ncbi:hypothetical protein, partial [Xanthomonas translucens]|uniref:hypothetical protein n=1 Tax=Xanthomonas campestris pv. translucens TaxID=343 RepID=UPI0012D863EA
MLVVLVVRLGVRLRRARRRARLGRAHRLLPRWCDPGHVLLLHRRTLLFLSRHGLNALRELPHRRLPVRGGLLLGSEGGELVRRLPWVFGLGESGLLRARILTVRCGHGQRMRRRCMRHLHVAHRHRRVGVRRLWHGAALHCGGVGHRHGVAGIAGRHRHRRVQRLRECRLRTRIVASIPCVLAAQPWQRRALRGVRDDRAARLQHPLIEMRRGQLRIVERVAWRRRRRRRELRRGAARVLRQMR